MMTILILALNFCIAILLLGLIYALVTWAIGVSGISIPVKVVQIVFAILALIALLSLVTGVLPPLLPLRR